MARIDNTVTPLWQIPCTVIWRIFPVKYESRDPFVNELHAIVHWFGICLKLQCLRQLGPWLMNYRKFIICQINWHGSDGGHTMAVTDSDTAWEGCFLDTNIGCVAIWLSCCIHDVSSVGRTLCFDQTHPGSLFLICYSDEYLTVVEVLSVRGNMYGAYPHSGLGRTLSNDHGSVVKSFISTPNLVLNNSNMQLQNQLHIPLIGWRLSISVLLLTWHYIKKYMYSRLVKVNACEHVDSTNTWQQTSPVKSNQTPHDEQRCAWTMQINVSDSIIQ